MRFVLASIVVAALVSTATAQTSEPVGSPHVCQPSPDASRFRVTHADMPLYPPLARQARLQGSVFIHISIKDGSVMRAEVTSSKPEALKMLPIAASDNVKTWHFAADVSGETEAEFTYELIREESYVPENPRVEMELPTCVRIVAKSPKPIRDTVVIKKPD